MIEHEASHLPVEQRIALAYTPVSNRPALAAYFALDRRLGQITANTTEPMLGQVRLAWWREMLAKPKAERLSGDAVLDSIGEHWEGYDETLSKLLDAWEVFIVAEKLDQNLLKQFAADRAHPFSRFFPQTGQSNQDRPAAAAQRWVLVDTLARVSDPEERASILEVLEGLPSSVGGHTRSLRGLAVLEALALRALKRGGRPIMEGRGAALLALRVGIFGK